MIKATITATIGGESRTIKFGTNATHLFCERYQIGLNGFSELFRSENIRPGYLRDFIWSGLVAGGTDVTPEVVGDWIDDMEQTELERIMSSFDTPPAGKTGAK